MPEAPQAEREFSYSIHKSRHHDFSHSIHRSSKEYVEEAEEQQKAIGDFIRHMQHDSPFFIKQPPRLLPMFEPKEVELGLKLGQGEFGTVREVEGMMNTSGNNSLNRFLKAHNAVNGGAGVETSGQGKVSFMVEGDISEFDPDATENQDMDVTDHSISRRGSITFEQFHFARQNITGRCIREGRARYAVKRLREDVHEEDYESIYGGLLDLSIEATFLSSLAHPNIIKIRATVGNPGDSDFMMVMDRLYETVEERVEDWQIEEFGSNKGSGGLFSRFKRSSGGGSSGGGKRLSFLKRSQSKEISEGLISRVVVAYDVARAFRYLHSNKIIYRDLKPANVGFDIRGDVRVFDFGMVKELRDEDLIQLPDDYNCTGLTGSRRWMAPEVVLCEPYGLSCDVYSWGLFFWHLCSLKLPFGNIDAEWHCKNVVYKGVRPKKLKYLPIFFQELMSNCWSEDRSKRPSMDRICRSLQSQIMALRQKAVDESGKYKHRSMFLRQKSKLSLRTIATEPDQSLNGGLNRTNHTL